MVVQTPVFPQPKRTKVASGQVKASGLSDSSEAFFGMTPITPDARKPTKTAFRTFICYKLATHF